MSVVSRLRHFQFPRPEQLFADPAARLKTARITVEVILSAAIVAQVASSGISIAQLSGSHPLPPAPRPRIHSNRSDSPQVAARIASAHLFGFSQLHAPGTEVTTAAPPDWVLTGTLASKKPNHGRAILSSKDVRSRLVAVGDEVAPAYQLAQVYRDYVVLKHEGELMTVRLKKTIPGTGLQIGEESVAQQSMPAEAKKAPVERPENFVLADALLQPDPWIDASGRYAGISLSGRTNSSTLKRYGFRDDDVITAVNGRQITNLISAQKALKDMSKGMPTSVTVVRNGAPEQVSVTLVDDGSF